MFLTENHSRTLRAIVVGSSEAMRKRTELLELVCRKPQEMSQSIAIILFQELYRLAIARGT